MRVCYAANNSNSRLPAFSRQTRRGEQVNETQRYQPIRVLLAFCLSLVCLPAFADLMINPTRVVFDKNQRSASIDLINDGSKPATYRVNVVNRRMSEDGQFIPVEKALPGEQFADSMLVYSPRQFTIQPGTSQVVRIAVRKPAGLQAGEYRSHLSFDRLPDAEDATNIENVNKPASGSDIGVRVTALLGVSIPVIIREGETAAQVTISNIEVRKPAAAGQPFMVSLQLNRNGNRSVYGDLVVNFTPAGGKPVVLARAGGVAVYTPNPLRRATLNLQLPAGTDLKQGRVSVAYQERSDEGGKTIADASIDLP